MCIDGRFDPSKSMLWKVGLALVLLDIEAARLGANITGLVYDG
jgi:hypothetical protein